MVQVAGGVLVAGGLVVGLAALAVLHVLPTGLSPVRNAVSQYGITAYRTGYRVQTIAYGVAGIGAGVGLATLPGSVTVVVALCAAFAAARLSISWFPMDNPGSPRTESGHRHGLLAIVAFVAVGLAGWRLADLLGQDTIHPGVAGASEAFAILMAISLVAMVVDRRSGGNHFGLLERSFYVWMSAWLATVAVLLFVSA